MPLWSQVTAEVNFPAESRAVWVIRPALRYQDIVLLSLLYSLLFYFKTLLSGSNNFSKGYSWGSILTNIQLQTKGHIPCIFLSDGAPWGGEMPGRMLKGSMGLPYTALPLHSLITTVYLVPCLHSLWWRYTTQELMSKAKECLRTQWINQDWTK